MTDRSFSDIDLRDMLEAATAYHPDATPGRWTIETHRGPAAWKVIGEPDEALKKLIVVTAFPVE